MFARDSARPALVLTMFLCVARLRVLSSGRLDASMRVDGGCETSGFPGPAGEGVAILATWHGGQRVGRSVPVVKAKECEVVQDFVRVWRDETREVSLSQFGNSRSNGAICGVMSLARFTSQSISSPLHCGHIQTRTDNHSISVQPDA